MFCTLHDFLHLLLAVIDWFFPWPHDALESVALRYLGELPALSPALRTTLSQHMAFVHLCVTSACSQFLATERRYNYATPTSFLELLKFYQTLYTGKSVEVQQQKDRLDKGISIIKKTQQDVSLLQEVSRFVLFACHAHFAFYFTHCFSRNWKSD